VECEKVRNGRQCGLRRSEPRKVEPGARKEDPRGDDERIFGPFERRICNRKDSAHCAGLKGEESKEEGILFG
jgi:hypothetical protein